ncbi:MAG: protein kinase [Thermomonas sp.]|uniref:serine/threonine-protein kinase n=1 Tax=Thermomonas sp. TaxID=1971895 RepID=UPI001ECA13F4|nr:serine/threonine-protein kinase [Thermomonas sp.]MBV2209132.1 protein kinase [Thermomonas sp.]
MPHTRSRRAFLLFDELIDLPAAQRATRLDAITEEDPALREEVERLLAADTAQTAEEMEQRLSQWAADLVPAAAEHDIDIGKMLGPWRIVSALGQGGMGSVWMAEREGEGFQQRAAIKLIALGLGTAAARERFLRERGILAQLDHPHIAALLDGGVSPSGQPYFAMAYVEGDRIDHWCDARRLSVRDRIRLFLQVLDAVQYAHRNLIVHRDLKPANVMVDNDGHVKLLDFGIAKLLEDSDRAATRDTAMTPQYAAPEQLLGSPVTTACDIYQLGLLLYTLLVGGHPFGVTADTPITALLRTLDNTPRSLPQAARTLAAEALAQRNASRAELVRRVSGDLSAIVATCIAREPERRYPSADALRADLQRWLDGQPVAVRSSSRAYRIRRFLRRYRWGIAATLATITALSVGLLLAIQQMNEAKRQALRAEQVKDVVLSVFREQDPLLRAANDQRPPQQIIAEGVATLHQQTSSDPALRAELLNDLGEIQFNLGDPKGAIETLETALSLRTKLSGAITPEAMGIERKLAAAANSFGDKPSAIAHAQRAIVLSQQLNTPDATDAARAKLVLALAYINSEKRDQALALTESAVTSLTKTLGKAAPETLEALYRQAQMLTQFRRDDEAIAVLNNVIALTEASSGKDSARLLQPLTALGAALRQATRYQEALPIYARLLAITQKHYQGKSKLLASAHSRYGMLLADLGDLNTAQALLQKAETALPDGENLELAQLLANRTKLYIKLNQADAVEATGKRAFEVRRQATSDDDGITWYYASEWARGLAMQGKYAQAEYTQKDALTRLRKIIGPKAYQNVLILDALADTLHLQKRYTEELPLRRESLAITTQKYDATNENYKNREQALRVVEQALQD